MAHTVAHHAVALLQKAIRSFLQPAPLWMRSRLFTCPTSQLVSLRMFSALQSELPPHRLEHAVSPAVAAQLQARGFALIDDIFGSRAATALRQEIEALRQDGHMHLNSTHLVRGGARQLLQKRGIFEAELMDSDVQAAAPLLAQLQHDSTLRTLLSVYLPQHKLVSQAIKAQFNEGQGACFPMHFDSDEAVDGRRLSAIVYLNSGWEPAHGGALRLFPFGSAPVDIAPRHDRLVLFASTRMLHRVMPATAPRACFTIWFSDAPRQARAPPPSEVVRSALQQAAEHGGRLPAAVAEQLLRQPDVQKLAAKLHYADQWAASIEDSHDDSEGRAAALRSFWQELGLVRRVLAPLEAQLRGAFPGAADAEPQLMA